MSSFLVLPDFPLPSELRQPSVVIVNVVAHGAARKTAMGTTDVQYISDDKGDLTAVIVPIALWREIVSEFETQYLLRSEEMRRRLLEARGRSQGIALEEVLERLGVE